jgi:hypothetical protein
MKTNSHQNLNLIVIVESGVVVGVRSQDDNIKVKVKILDADNMDSEDFEAEMEEAENKYPVEIL